jgi:ribose transport system ATP-binding protein
VSKRFGAVVALDDAHITLRSGEVRALVGANGSGKSTLVKILSGFHRPDSGVMKIGDIEADLSDDWRHGEHWQVGTVHQDLGLIAGVSVVENFLLPELAVGHAGSVKLNWHKSQDRRMPSCDPGGHCLGASSLDPRGGIR